MFKSRLVDPRDGFTAVEVPNIEYLLDNIGVKNVETAEN